MNAPQGRLFSVQRLAVLLTVLALSVLGGIIPTPAAAATDPCGAAGSPVTCENSKPGNPQSEWDVTGSGDAALQGFATQMSVNIGNTVHFKIKATASNYRIDIYRLGYYQSLGARKIATVTSATYPQSQPNCLTDATTGLIDCGNWAESASWTVPAGTVSGIFIARLVRLDNGGASQIPFVVRNDSSHSDVVFQTSDTSWEAYNTYGGNSLYQCTVACPPGNPKSYYAAFKVSYNRPFHTRDDDGGHSQVFWAEWPMLMFLERNGYDVSYIAGVDAATRGPLLINHKTFMSVGHDEYWSADQRNNVLAARDAGVNLAFFSGNEMFWKTRWEPSIDGTSTAGRTLVSYKETHFDAQVDPAGPSVWTGTWRDTRFSPPGDAIPENALTGTIYVADPPATFAMTVPGTYAKLRFWRNTAIANLTPSQTATLADETLGYEFDADLDNGYRPAGLFDLTQQTESIDHMMLDYGSTVGPGNATHAMTLYRAPSGALVFGAGTVQWSWGLDDNHDGDATATDARMQQATVNLLADMGVQPLTLMAGLTAATKSTDTSRPTATISASGTHGVVATPLTVSGTASDAGGGVVAGVEVSIDGGTSWHPATGTTSWSYTVTPTSPGTVNIQARAVDDSGNLQSPAAAGTRTIDRRTCPCNIFGSITPPTVDSGDANAYELGMRWRATINGQVTGVRFYKSSANTGTHTGSLWSNTGALLATGTFAGESSTGWQTLSFTSPVSVTAGTTYVVSYHTTSGHYADNVSGFSQQGVYSAPLLALPDGTDGANGIYALGASAFPNQTNGSTNYYVDVIFTGDTSADTQPPTVTSTAPLDTSSSNPLSTTLSANFSKPVNASSFQFSVKAGSTAVPANVTVGAGGLSARLIPSQQLQAGTTYTASITASDYAGDTMSSPYTWTFRTGSAHAQPGQCPCTVWSDLQQPTNVMAADSNAVELGVKFRASASGWITGTRFFKSASNTGRHVGSLWTTSGQRLAFATFSNETASGWQTVNFDPAVQVTAGTTYIVSYHTNTGFYSYDRSYFAGGATTYGPLTALQSGTDGGNGVFAYSSAPTFPETESGTANNYWVDPVFNTTQPPPLPPTVTDVTPLNGTTGASLYEPLTATFNKAMNAATIAFTVQAGGNPVPGTVTYDSTSATATFVPAAGYPAGSAVSVSLTGNGADGTGMTQSYTWGFGTGIPATCPCSLWPSGTPGTASANDSGAYELGVRFTSDENGYVSAVRFYKGAGNTGTHTGTLWSAGGVKLATGSFTNETASGWQTLTFDAPVPVTAGTTYVASYNTATGHYAYDDSYFAASAWNASPLHASVSTGGAPNGVFYSGGSGFPTQTYHAANYWVDVVFTTTATDSQPPRVVSTWPSAGAGGVSLTGTPSATFSEPVQAGSVSMTVSSAAGPVSGTVRYDSNTPSATFTPSSPLAAATSYTVRTSASDLSGNAMASAFQWTFTTVAVSNCPCSLLGDVTPDHVSSNAGDDIEVGVRFSSDVGGHVTAIRFYKAAGNTGAHTGTLWTAGGTLLATGTFTNETASGWQTLTLATPVTIQPNTIYVASVHDPNGNWSWSPHYYDAGLDVGPLHAPAPNGVYNLGAGFPTNSANNTNYYVDVVVQ